MTLLSVLIWATSWWSYQHSLPNDPLLAKHFSRQEITQLDNIRTFFNQQIMKNCHEDSSIKACYQQYLDRLNKADRPELNISYAEQKNLYKKIDKDLYHKIWQDSVKGRDPGTRKMISRRELGYNMKGTYIKFLQDVARKEPYFHQYTEAIEVAGELPPSLLDGFAYNPSGLDFNNERHQLILAIHFLTFNDQRVNNPK